jgi:hypothetical protein
MRTMHLYGDILESYARRELPARELAAIDAHVSNCLFCAHAFTDEAVLMANWERSGWLGRLVRVERPDGVDGPAEDFELRAA